MRRIIPVLLLFLIFNACGVDKGKILDEFKEIPTDGWGWNDARTFTFTIEDSSYLYNLECGLRITGSYKYSNLWLLYTIDGPNSSVKNQFQIQLSDNTGKWLGDGKSNLISYRQFFLQNVKFKKGKYTLQFNQNMRDEKLTSVSDIGLKVYKSSKVY